MSSSVLIAAATTAELAPAPIPRQWILRGSPMASSMRLARSHDGTSSVVVWECSPGEFNWHYFIDETVFIISGEVLISRKDGAPEELLSEGQMAYFPAGNMCTWRVTKTVKKIAFLRHHLPLPMGFGVRAWHKALELVRIRGGSSL